MAFWVYMLRCKDGSYYVGHTDDVEVRLAQHESGALEGYTSKRRPVILVFAEPMPTRDEAFQRERQIKTWSRGKKEALIARDWERLHQIVHAEWRAEGLSVSAARPSTALGTSGIESTPVTGSSKATK